jgi:hypothetical protein
MRFMSLLDTIAAFLRLRFLLGDFFVRMWLV